MKKPISRLPGKPRLNTAKPDVAPSAVAGSNDQSLTEAAAAAIPAHALPMKEFSNFTLSSEPSSVGTTSEGAAAAASAVAADGGPPSPAAALQPEPYLALQRVDGYTGQLG